MEDGRSTMSHQLSLSALFLCLSIVPAAAQVTAIRAGQLVDPETGTVALDQTILVEAGMITAVGADVPVPPEADVHGPSPDSRRPARLQS